MFRPELKQPKNAAGMVLIVLSVLIMFIQYEYSLPRIAAYIAIGLYVVGMVLIVIPGRADPDPDHDAEGGKDE